MNITILGAAGFIGTNLTIQLAKDNQNKILLADKKIEFFNHIKAMNLRNVNFTEADFDLSFDMYKLLEGQDIVYHLVSSTVPTTSNQHISQELMENVVFSSNLLDACVRAGVKKVIFISSGGTVYGREGSCPLSEEMPTKPISSYGIQKITIEKLLYLYEYMYGLDYRIIRLSNPYGPYQRPNGILGAVTTFSYKALMGEPIIVYGDGSVVRDFIYIDDAVRGLLNIAESECNEKTYNLGCGYGTSIRTVLETLQEVIGKTLDIKYQEGRAVDVPINYLDISRYEENFGTFNPISLKSGIKKTIDFMTRQYKLEDREAING